ncbi:hypothetical protein Vi05172_g11532 [Venturia inaequalis]|nr:hypothetical protein Vi05172_g11532 [Venturia inaequalis]
MSSSVNSHLSDLALSSSNASENSENDTVQAPASLANAGPAVQPTNSTENGFVDIENITPLGGDAGLEDTIKKRFLSLLTNWMINKLRLEDDSRRIAIVVAKEVKVCAMKLSTLADQLRDSAPSENWEALALAEHEIMTENESISASLDLRSWKEKKLAEKRSTLKAIVIHKLILAKVELDSHDLPNHFANNIIDKMQHEVDPGTECAKLLAEGLARLESNEDGHEESDSDDEDPDFALHEDWDIPDPAGDRLAKCVKFFILYNEIMSGSPLESLGAMEEDEQLPIYQADSTIGNPPAYEH